MTTIAAYSDLDRGETIVAADTGVGVDWATISNKANKLYRVGGGVAAFSGVFVSAAHIGRRLQDNGSVRLDEDKDMYEIQRVILDMFKLDFDYFLEDEPTKFPSGLFALTNGKIFTMDAALSITEHDRNMAAIGSGWSFAIGTMSATAGDYGKKWWESPAVRGIHVASRYDNGTGERVTHEVVRHGSG